MPPVRACFVYVCSRVCVCARVCVYCVWILCVNFVCDICMRMHIFLVCVSICVCVCMDLCVFVCMCLGFDMCMHLCVCFVCMYVWIHVCLHGICVYKCVCVYVWVHMFVRVYVFVLLTFVASVRGICELLVELWQEIECEEDIRWGKKSVVTMN